MCSEVPALSECADYYERRRLEDSDSRSFWEIATARGRCCYSDLTDLLAERVDEGGSSVLHDRALTFSPRATIRSSVGKSSTTVMWNAMLADAMMYSHRENQLNAETDK